jgi:hypothetical protein
MDTIANWVDILDGVAAGLSDVQLLLTIWLIA